MVTMLALSVLAYFVGSIPTGLIIGKVFYKKDLREYGSKNIGATNAFRVLGKKPAFFVLLGDAAKGAFGVWLFMPNPEWMLLGGILAMIGHNCSIFLGFKGGKGVATGLGVLATLVPKVALIALGIWMMCVALTKYVSLGSIVAAILVPVAMLWFGMPWLYVAFGAFTALFVIYRHMANIRRLLRGEELKVERLKK